MKHLAFVFLLLVGCSSQSPLSDGYQLGDATREALHLQHMYCEKSDPIARLALRKILEAEKVLPLGMSVCDVDVIAWLEGK